jgi:hypothetical protein
LQSSWSNGFRASPAGPGRHVDRIAVRGHAQVDAMAARKPDRPVLRAPSRRYGWPCRAPVATRLLPCEAAVGESVRPTTCDPMFFRYTSQLTVTCAAESNGTTSHFQSVYDGLPSAFQVRCEKRPASMSISSTRDRLCQVMPRLGCIFTTHPIPGANSGARTTTLSMARFHFGNRSTSVIYQNTASGAPVTRPLAVP